MKKRVMIINGPNLNLIGKREQDIYGDQDFITFFTALKQNFEEVQLEYFQSNVEGELINKLHEVGFAFDGIIFNPGGYSHTSVALRDAVLGIKTPVIEVHISNLHAREEFRHQSLTAFGSIGVISGFGLWSYEMALQFLLDNF
jgi:3-dehydroquinate dehydratase-2